MGARSALVVANDEYADPGLARLRSPGQDAAALAEVLGDPDVGQFDVEIVRNGSVQLLRERLDEFFGSAGPGDELLVHFSCHGLKDGSSDLYLAATDTRPSLLASTGLPADFVARRMRASRARTVALLLDCCYGGAFERGMLARAGGEVAVLDSFGPGTVAEGAGRVVITASSAVEYAFESGDLTDAGTTSPSVFTSAIVEGISTGEADADGSGTISIHELFAYAEKHIRRANPQQTPHMWSFGTRGDIVVAHSPLRRVLPASLPITVQTALAGDRISRLGAVQVLSGLLDDPDLSIVLAAVQALDFLVDDDSRSVSAAAGDALRQVRLTATPARLDMDLVTGQQPASVEVVLGGSRLGLTARVASVPDWVHVRQIGDRLIVRVSPATSTNGTIKAEGPTGSVDIPVMATVRAPEPRAAPGYEHPAEEAQDGASGRPDQSERPASAGLVTDGAPQAFANEPRPVVWARRLWGAAGLCALLMLAVPIDSTDGWRISSPDDVGGGQAGLWIVAVSALTAVMFTLAWRFRTPVAVGIVTAAVTTVFAVTAVVIAVSYGEAVGTAVALAAALMADTAAALTIAAWHNGPEL
jgi:hypothetical protein